MNIELAYWILFSIIAIIGILTFTNKMSFGIGIIGLLAGFVISYLLAPYMNIVMQPVGQAIFYGGAFTFPVILAIIHFILMVIAVFVAIYNLMSSEGEIIWA